MYILFNIKQYQVGAISNVMWQWFRYFFFTGRVCDESIAYMHDSRDSARDLNCLLIVIREIVTKSSINPFNDHFFNLKKSRDSHFVSLKTIQFHKKFVSKTVRKAFRNCMVFAKTLQFLLHQQKKEED